MNRLFKTRPRGYQLRQLNLKQPRGVALIVGLIFLIILTLFVLGSLREVLMQEPFSFLAVRTRICQFINEAGLIEGGRFVD